MLSYWTLLAYSSSLILWGINESIGNDGSIFHMIFAYSLYFQKAAPLLSLYLLMDLQSAYLPTDASYTYYNTLTTVVAAPNKMEYLTDPGQTDGTAQNYAQK